MNIEKKVGDLSFKYLDMSNYFEKTNQKVFIRLRSQDIINALDIELIKLRLKCKI
jgi:hypothetical protein